MAIVDWTFSPVTSIDREFDRLRRQVEDVFGRFSLVSGLGAGFPALNLYDMEDNIVVAVEAPGLSKEDLTVEVRENVLTISGKRGMTDFGDAAVLREERFAGEFRRTLRITASCCQKPINASSRTCSRPASTSCCRSTGASLATLAAPLGPPHPTTGAPRASRLW